MLNKRIEEHSFSLEIASDRCVKRISFQASDGIVFFEGFLGRLRRVCIVEDLMLQIDGSNGTLRIDICRKDLEDCLSINAKSAEEGARR